MKILIIGSGGREHCLAWKLKQSSGVKGIFCAPGNGGTSSIAKNVDIDPGNIAGLLDFAVKENIDLTVVGPEAPLVAGIVDTFEEKGLGIFGPRREVALLEGSKVYAKDLMKKFGIPTAESAVFSDAGAAKEYIKKKGAPIVVKADGLAAGKGVIVCNTLNQAVGAVEFMMEEKAFGRAGAKIVVEECLTGEEASVLVLTDSKVCIPLVPSQDHKRVFDNDQGPNTGGMGAYAPAPLVDDKMLDSVMSTVARPLVAGLKQEGKDYRGILYIGLMIVKGKPFVLEFNVRFGDPETQVILPRLKSDLAQVMLATAQGRLAGTQLDWDRRHCLCAVLAAGGYPGDYAKGKPIAGLENFPADADCFLFHAGTKKIEDPDGGQGVFLTNGGRVLNVAALGNDLKSAKAKVYAAIKTINFEGMHYRKDIGDKAIGGRYA